MGCLVDFFFIDSAIDGPTHSKHGAGILPRSLLANVKKMIMDLFVCVMYGSRKFYRNVPMLHELAVHKTNITGD